MNTLSTSSWHLGVVGDPVEHSRSPQLHRAAYDVLSLDWSYDRQRVTAGNLLETVQNLDASWLGLSVTMPLKQEAFALAKYRDAASKLTGVSNTLLFDGKDWDAFNTDVLGLVNPLKRIGVASLLSATVVGSGATARSALVAAAHLGVEAVVFVARSPERVTNLIQLGHDLGIESSYVDIEKLGTVAPSPLTISTIPGSADVNLDALVSPDSILFDIAYDVWPSVNAQRWHDRGGRTISGLSMLAAQALEQVRIFVTGSDETPLPREDEVRLAMNAAVGLDESGLILRSIG